MKQGTRGGDRRRFVESQRQVLLPLRQKLQEISPKYNVDIESVAVAWLIKLGALPLIGTKDEQRIRNIVNAFNIQLDHQDWYDLYTASKGNI